MDMDNEELRSISNWFVTFLPSEELNDFYYETRDETATFTFVAQADPDRLAYIKHPLTMITSVLGLPNRRLDDNEPQSLKNILQNLAGWRPDLSWPAAIIRTIPALAWNLIRAAARLPRNLLQLTAFTLAALPLQFAMFLHHSTDGSSPLLNTLAQIGSYIMAGVGFVNAAALLLLQPFISPLSSLSVGWRFVNYMLKDKVENTPTIAGRVVGALVVTISALITLTTYGFLLPLALSAIVPSFATSFLNSLGPLTTGLSSIGNTVITPIFGNLLNGVSSALSGFGFLAGLANITIAKPIGSLLTKLNHWWNHPTTEEVAKPEFMHDWDKDVAPARTNNATAHQTLRAAPRSTGKPKPPAPHTPPSAGGDVPASTIGYRRSRLLAPKPAPVTKPAAKIAPVAPRLG